MGKEPSRELTCIRRRLLTWYDRHHRDLPWRRRANDAYAQLLAEFMLQQTQVSTVLGYYERFVKRFPTVQALASASLDEVLALWSGLGYYSRARNLHAAARRIVDEYGGTVPQTLDELVSLPGIGRYTAGAIASIAYGVRAPVLDGNVIRVLMRLTAMKADPKSPAVRARLWKQAEQLLPSTRCGDFNQALMELGATLCSPRNPNCATCPLSRRCQACLHGIADRIPQPTKPARVLPARMVVAAIRRNSELLFVQRPHHGLWAGLWELPTEPVGEDESIASAHRRLQFRLPVPCRLSARPIGRVTRALTHRRITFEVLTGRARNGQDPPRPWRWVAPSRTHTLAISRACEAIIGLLETDHPPPGKNRSRINQTV